MQGNGASREPPSLPNGALWQRSRITDAAEDEAGCYLDLAGFADGLLDADDSERVAEWLGRDPIAAGDVVAARALVSPARQSEAVPESVLARACALVGGGEPQPGTVVPFRSGRKGRPALPNLARWAGLAAATVLASWLGFTLGMDTSRSLAQRGLSSEDSFFNELLDPSTGFLRDLSEGAQT